MVPAQQARHPKVLPSRSDERGIALALALFALVILGAVVSGAFVVSRYNQGAAVNTAYATDAQNASDAGLAYMYTNWDPYTQSALPIYDGTSATMWGSATLNVNGNPLVTYVDSVRRLNTQIFLVESTGRRLSNGGTVVLSELKSAQIYRLAKPTIGVNAAITVQDPLTLNGNAFTISGINAIPPQWGVGECDAVDPGNGDDVVGVRSAVGTGVNTQDWDNVTGFPARDAPNDPSITNATFQNYLDYTYTTLASQPNVVILADNQPYNNVGPTVLGGVCDKANYGTNKNDPQNLGEPYRAPTTGVVPLCYGYYPVVHGTGSDTEFAAGSRGQGTLLVDGNLKLNGGFVWDGLIIIRGQMNIAGNGNKVTGAVLAEGFNINVSGTISGNIDVSYSACAIEKAVGGATYARPLGQRSWLQSY